MTYAAIAVGVGAVAGGVGSAIQSGNSTKQVSSLNNAQQRISNQLGSYLHQGVYGSYNSQGQLQYNARTATPYNGPLQAPLMPGYGQALGLLQGYNPAQMSQQYNSLWQNAMSGKPSYQAQLDPTTTANYFQQSVANPMMHTFQNQILPQINEGFAGVGAFSSRQGQAGQQALSDLQSTLTGQLGADQLQNQQMQQQLNAQLADSAANRQAGALSAYGTQQINYANQPLTAANAMSSVLGGLQTRADTGVTDQYNNFLRQAPENSPYINQMLGYVGMPQTNTVMQPNYVSQALQGGSAGLGIYSLLQPQQAPQQQQNPNNLYGNSYPFYG